MKAIRIYKKDNGDKEWVEVKFEQKFDKDLGWLPRLEDLGQIARLLWEVEENKYANGPEGGEKVRRFLNEAMDGEDIIELCRKHQIPEERISDKVKFEPYTIGE